METLQPWAADWPSWKIPNGARELIWATIVRRGLSSVRARTWIKSPRKWRRVGKFRPLKAFLRVTFALLSGGLLNRLGGGPNQSKNKNRLFGVGTTLAVLGAE